MKGYGHLMDEDTKEVVSWVMDMIQKNDTHSRTAVFALVSALLDCSQSSAKGGYCDLNSKAMVEKFIQTPLAIEAVGRAVWWHEDPFTGEIVDGLVPRPPTWGVA